MSVNSLWDVHKDISDVDINVPILETRNIERDPKDIQMSLGSNHHRDTSKLGYEPYLKSTFFHSGTESPIEILGSSLSNIRSPESAVSYLKEGMALNKRDLLHFGHLTYLPPKKRSAFDSK